MDMRFSICNEMFKGWDWRQVCECIGRHGYDGVEIAPFTFAEDIRNLNEKDRIKIRSESDLAGLRIVGLHWLLVSPAGLSCTSPSADVRRTTSDYLVELTRFCSDLGGEVMVFGSPKQRIIPMDGGRDVAVQRLCETLQPSALLAEKKGITICLEPLPKEETDFINTLEEAAELIMRFDSPAVKTILDVKSAGTEDHAIPELIKDYGSMIQHVHANDTNRKGPGFGDTDFVPIFAALREAKYDGWVSVEVFDYTPDPETIARESMRYMKESLHPEIKY